MKQSSRILAIVFAMLFVAMVFSGCSGSSNYEKKLADSWYGPHEETPRFTLYSDGTCKINHEYGTGKWAVVNEDQLKITNFYGEAQVFTIISIKGGCLTLEKESNWGTSTTELWNSPQE